MEQSKTEETKKRPTFLTVLCILSFIGGGLGVLIDGTLALGVNAIASMMGDMVGSLAGGKAYFAVGMVLASTSLFSAIQMWKLKKMGFYLYAAVGIISVILPIIWLGSPFSIMGFVGPLVFVVLFGLNLKHMS